MTSLDTRSQGYLLLSNYVVYLYLFLFKSKISQLIKYVNVAFCV